MSLNDRTAQAPSAVAWDTPGTRAALGKWLAQHTAKSLGWLVALVALLYCTVVVLPPWAAWIPVPAFGLLMYCLMTSLLRMSNFRRMYLILINYPWLQQHDGVHMSKGKVAVFVLPDPDNPAKTASPKEPGVLLKRWNRVVRKGFKDELWYAGDPRFAVVVAEPGFRSMGYARQPTAFSPRTSPRSRGLSPEARRRAMAIGARLGPERGESRSRSRQG
ncbi:hypothetical protein GCM10012287_54700 [Streptomyces daqingensis]|uniref:Uncharacterized protein n=1 Tax=Streptomyces daqingensis TaxID=1472640 RepID=A0ABQ2MTZ3_9ACTN|nr:hypothetical protein [Streptomyces daqingensis]GGO57854.1 hypothetical protein GCM10012287_54700 [Streptomyces daqingensis]